VNRPSRIPLLALLGLLFLAANVFAGPSPKVLFIAGTGSHGFGAHEFRAGALLLANELDASGLDIETAVSEYGWPEDESIFEGVTSVVMLCTGEDAHLLNEHLDFFDHLADKGVGLVLIHTSTITTAGAPGDHFIKWAGGYHELYYSVVHTWEANFESLPEHPITRGVKPFVFDDEWNFHMRFRPGLEDVTPILSAHPNSDDVLNLKSGKLKGDDQVKAAVARGEIQHLAWAFDRPGGGRGFGFTGAHDHWSWADTNYRKLVLNAILWTAHGEVPEGGVPAAPLTLNELLAHQDSTPKIGTTLDDLLEAIPAPLADSDEKPDFHPRPLLAWDDAASDQKRIAFLAGTRSGAYGTRESYAGSVLLGRELEAAFPEIDVAIFTRPFSKETYDQLASASAIVFHTEEGPPNPLDKGSKPVADILASGIGAVALTGSLVATPGKGDILLATIGARAISPAAFQDRRLHFETFPDHPVCRGVDPFEIEDGWLAGLEFNDDTITPILTDPSTGTPLLWLSENKVDHRAVGFAGGFHHFALANANYRRLLLNAIAWSAGLEISEQGIPTQTLSLEALQQNQNHRPPGHLDWNEMSQRFGTAD
jgi:hypothetical protein